MTQVVLLTGRLQSGKDTACMKIRECLKLADKSVEIYSFAKSLKDFLIDVMGLTHNQCYGSNADKDTFTKLKWSNLPVRKEVLGKLWLNAIDTEFMTAREVMQIFGSEIIRAWYDDAWVRSCKNKIDKDGLDYALVADARFPNEIDYLLPSNPIVIRLTRKITDSQHISEIALDHYDWNKISKYHLIDNQEMNIDQKNAALVDVMRNYIQC